MPFLAQRDVDIHAGYHDRVAHRNNVRRALCAHDSADLRDIEHIALFHAAGFYKLEGLGIDKHSACRDSRAHGVRLFGHIHHFGSAVFVKMSKISHNSLS